MRFRSIAGSRLIAFCLTLVVSATPVFAADVAPLVDKGTAFLEKAQAEDGSWSSDTGVGVTALVATALLKNGKTADDPDRGQSD